MTALFDDEQTQTGSSRTPVPAAQSAAPELARTALTPGARVQVWGDPIPPPPSVLMLAGSAAVWVTLAAIGYGTWRWLGT